MAPLNTFQVPLSKLPDGYGWEERDDISIESTTSAFATALEGRDTFLGQKRCVVCGVQTPRSVVHCFIIPQLDIWRDLQDRDWIPQQSKDHPQHDPHNGLLMCTNHQVMFDNYCFFIRFIPNTQQFVLVNYAEDDDLAQFHGKAIALDIRDLHAPFPSLFIIHEMRVRGFHPFMSLTPDMPDADDLDGILWQDWIVSQGVFDDAAGAFKRKGIPPPRASGHGDGDASLPQFPQFPPETTTMAAAAASGCDAPGEGRKLDLNADVVAEILAATRASPSWRACVMEGTSWTGTAEENIEKYVSSVGVQPTDDVEAGNPKQE